MRAGSATRSKLRALWHSASALMSTEGPTGEGATGCVYGPLDKDMVAVAMVAAATVAVGGGAPGAQLGTPPPLPPPLGPPPGASLYAASYRLPACANESGGSKRSPPGEGSAEPPAVKRRCRWGEGRQEHDGEGSGTEGGEGGRAAGIVQCVGSRL